MHEPCNVFCDRGAIAEYIIKEGLDVRVVAAKNPFARGHVLVIPVGAYNSVADWVSAVPRISSVGPTLIRVINAIGAEWGWPVDVIEHGGQFTQNVPHGHIQIYHTDATRPTLQEAIATRARKMFEGTMPYFAYGAFIKLDPQFGYLAVGHFEGPVHPPPSLVFYDPSGFGTKNRQPGILRAEAARLAGRPHLAKSGQIPQGYQKQVDAWTEDTLHSLRLRLPS